jgi:hypothetical protein
LRLGATAAFALVFALAAFFEDFFSAMIFLIYVDSGLNCEYFFYRFAAARRNFIGSLQRT